MWVSAFFLPPPLILSLSLKTQRSLSSSRADYDRIHQRMMQELPQVLETRVCYFEHCLQAVIQAQVHTHIYTHNALLKYVHTYLRLSGTYTCIYTVKYSHCSRCCITTTVPDHSARVWSSSRAPQKFPRITN